MIAVFTENINEVKEILKTTEIENMISFMQCDIYEVILRKANFNYKINENRTQKKKFIIVSTGYGKANIGLAFAKAVNDYNIDNIIGVGNCGAVKALYPSVEDIAISKWSIQYDVDFTPVGTTSPMMIGVDKILYLADRELVALANACAKVNNTKAFNIKFGSADKFMSSNNDSIYNKLKFNIEAFDTQAGVIGQLANIADIPFVYVMGISNFANNKASEMYKENKEKANHTSQKVVIEMLKELTKID